MLSLFAASCTSPEKTLTSAAPVQSAPSQPTLPPAETPAVTAPTASAAPLAAPAQQVAQGSVRLEFAPVVGATVDAAAPLSRRLAQRAAERGYAMAQPGTAAATLVMKGYFSALSEGRQTIVVFVWDIMDAAGTRVHRIQGQERVQASGRDPWASVTSQTMEAIADRTMADFATWLSTRPG